MDERQIVGPHLIDSPFLGPIPPERLSGGVKTLIMIDHDDQHVCNASACGDNCAKWLLKIGAAKDRLGRLEQLRKGNLLCRKKKKSIRKKMTTARLLS
ncbi:MAG: DUF4869 domain-containing protein [Lachnospiraceae bacterium]|nr:DUF4869 domain-containing protein [Lachnospiraceae bacterium]